jgi:hypothetical protein
VHQCLFRLFHLEGFMLDQTKYYWIHCDQQAQAGDLRRVQIITTDELSLATDLRGPYDKLEDALRIAEHLLWSIVARVMERLRTEEPKPHATFPTSQTPTEE